jgi:hypothetical protein
VRSNASLHHNMLRQVYNYIAVNRLLEDRAEDTLVPVRDERINACNVPKLIRAINKLAQLRAMYGEPRMYVLDLRKTGQDSGLVVLAPTVGLGSLCK